SPSPVWTFILSLHDALPICEVRTRVNRVPVQAAHAREVLRVEVPNLGEERQHLERVAAGRRVAVLEERPERAAPAGGELPADDRSEEQRLNSSHVSISYAVF